MNTLTFDKYFEEYTNYHSFTDLMNLAKEVSDFVYNRDVVKSQFFDEFKETEDGFVILFNRSGKKNYFIDAKKEKVFDEKKDEQLIDSVYEDIENLYNILKNYELEINIQQMDEKVKTFGEIFINETPINEGFEEEFKDKIGNKYISLKHTILELLDNTLKSDTTKLQNFIENYIEPESDEVLEGFIESSDIFDIYLKCQSDIDQILKEKNYYDDPPEVESLYDYVIDGTFDAVVYCMEDMKETLFPE